jgi:hypothetical protein
MRTLCDVVSPKAFQIKMFTCGNFSIARANAAFTPGDAEPEAIESKRVDDRVRLVTQQFPIGDNVSQRQHPVRKHRVL